MVVSLPFEPSYHWNVNTKKLESYNRILWESSHLYSFDRISSNVKMVMGNIARNSNRWSKLKNQKGVYEQWKHWLNFISGSFCRDRGKYKQKVFAPTEWNILEYTREKCVFVVCTRWYFIQYFSSVCHLRFVLLHVVSNFRKVWEDRRFCDVPWIPHYDRARSKQFRDRTMPNGMVRISDLKRPLVSVPGTMLIGAFDISSYFVVLYICTNRSPSRYNFI